MQRPCPAYGCGLVADVLDHWTWRGTPFYELVCPAEHYYRGWTPHRFRTIAEL